MGTTELEIIAEKIQAAKRPKDLFGELPDTNPGKALAQLYRQMSRAIHPDRHGGDPLAHSAFIQLQNLYQAANEALAAATYDKALSVKIRTKKHRYDVFSQIDNVGAAAVYDCMIDGVTHGQLHMSASPRDNDLIVAEASSLKHLFSDTQAQGYFKNLPKFIESLVYKEDGFERRANAFESPEGFVSVEQVITEGLRAHPKDIAWMWRRLLDILGYAHHRGIIHGNVTPPNILIGVGDVHEIVLRNWQHSVRMETSQRIPAINPVYKGYYPPEVTKKEEPYGGTDTFMAAKSMLAMLEPGSSRIHGFLMACALPSKSARNTTAWGLREEFTTLIDSIWNRREYRPFVFSS